VFGVRIRPQHHDVAQPIGREGGRDDGKEGDVPVDIPVFPHDALSKRLDQQTEATRSLGVAPMS